MDGFDNQGRKGTAFAGQKLPHPKSAGPELGHEAPTGRAPSRIWLRARTKPALKRLIIRPQVVRPLLLNFAS
jgi:hypothetical protein